MIPVLVSLEELRSVIGNCDSTESTQDGVRDLAECVQSCLARTGDVVASEVVDWVSRSWRR